MTGFFKQEELKEFTFKDKLRWALRNIMNSCNPKEDYKYYDSFYDQYGKKHRYRVLICEFTEPKFLPKSEFPDLRFWIENETCFIELENAEYQFHLSQLLRVNKGLLKAIGKK